MSVKLPTLSSSGWVSAVAEKADRLMSYFIISEASQTHFYHNEISSLPDIIRRNPQDDFELRSEVQRTLVTYLGRYFDSVDVNVRTEEAKEGKGLDLIIDVTVVEDGKAYNLGRLISTLDSTIVRVANLNNTGEDK